MGGGGDPLRVVTSLVTSLVYEAWELLLLALLLTLLSNSSVLAYLACLWNEWLKYCCSHGRKKKKRRPRDCDSEEEEEEEDCDECDVLKDDDCQANDACVVM